MVGLKNRQPRQGSLGTQGTHHLRQNQVIANQAYHSARYGGIEIGLGVLDLILHDKEQDNPQNGDDE